ncbi:DUF6545 domain-containing protein [Umezawaea sp. Da 62-37]|uniref:DUF6545 domain-containing protein n=1 Tax=Umezawaea sp. Da 62-37 TaxID=3075927 RepID=UPI0028F74B33|nr:DUF6545 domain-containing protein [Umezawaea sp. Da 62-37]WNV83167.1 hypothetical protein RM788_33955 [Umezawaea sp. Da 62-37]
MIRTLVIPRPFDVDRFLASLAEKRGRTIKLIRGRLAADRPFGMLISTAEIDYIYGADNLPLLQFQHTVMHEVGHLLLGHFPANSGSDGAPRVAGDDVLQLLLPTLSPALVRRILGRTVHESAQEREAELFASLVLSRVTSARNTHTRHGPTPRDDLIAQKTLFDYRARRQVRQATRLLSPLWRRMIADVPQVRLDDIDEGALHRAERAQYRLYRRVMEIRDAQVLLRPHIPPGIPERVSTAADKRELDPVDADILREAAELHAALAAYRAGKQHHLDVVDVVGPRYSSTAPDLLTEARRLIRVSTALREGSVGTSRCRWRP